MAPHFDNVLDAQRFNDTRRREVEAAVSIYPSDKLRVRPTHYQAVATNTGQIVQFRPTEIIDDPHRIRIMDEHDVEYVVVSREKKSRKVAEPEEKPEPVAAEKQADELRAGDEGMPDAPEWSPTDSE